MASVGAGRKQRSFDARGGAIAGVGERRVATSRRRGRAGPAALAAAGVLCGLALTWPSGEDRSFAALPPQRRPSAALPPTALAAEAVGRSAVVAPAAVVDVTTFEERKAALKKRLVQEYASFFSPFRGQSYTDEMTFRDPLISTKGKNIYRWMLEFMGGQNMIGGAMFGDGFIDMYAIEELPDDEFKLRTRWTAGLKFKMMPWNPMIFFTGVSEYTIDENAQVTGQRDYWDTVNLGDEGRYVTEPIFSGYGDMAEQMLPPFVRSGAEPEHVHTGQWALLRRAAKYRVYRSKDGTVFALGHPDAAASDATDISRALRKHGLTPGKKLRVQLSGAGDVIPDESESDGDAAAASRKRPARAWPPARDDGEGETVLGLELLRPHPWDGRNAPPQLDD